MTIDQFVSKYNGVHVDEDGYYGAQCWDLVALYARLVVGCPSFPTGSGGAEGLFRIFAQPIPNYFDKLSADNAARGDVAVFPASFSPPWGHTALILSRSGNSLTVLEQNGNNPNGKSYTTTRYVSQLSGVLRPKKGSTEVIIGNDQGWRDRMNRFHHQLVYNADISDAVFQSTVGKELATVLVQWSDHSNANRLTQYQELGELASRDGWQNQIYTLQDWVKQRDTIINQNNQDLIALRQQIADFGERPTKQQLEEIQKSIADYEKKAMDAQAEVEKSRAELAKYKEEDAKTENAVLTWLKALFRIGNK